jgi:membrane protein
VLEDDPDLQDRILDSTLSQFPIIGEQLRDPQGLQGSGAAAVIGAVVALYGALGVAQALQNAMNVAWAVPRHRRPNPLTARGRSLLLVATAGVAVLATTTLSAFAGALGAGDGEISSPTSLAVTAGAVVVDAIIFAAVFRIATAARISFGVVLPGAFFASIVWQLLQVFGTAYVDGVVRDAGLAYGVFAIVLGLLAWIFLAALGVVVGVEMNVVRTKRLYPRALLTPFTDNVDLTSADRRSYTDAAVAQRHKGFEQVLVSFDAPHSRDTGPSALNRTITSGGEPPTATDLPTTDSAHAGTDTPDPMGDRPHDG